eukprot:1147312-Pelagomonas_calceolata.AAC.6
MPARMDARKLYGTCSSTPFLACVQVKAISQKISLRSPDAPFPEEISTDDEKQTLRQLGMQVRGVWCVVRGGLPMMLPVP